MLSIYRLTTKNENIKVWKTLIVRIALYVSSVIVRQQYIRYVEQSAEKDQWTMGGGGGRVSRHGTDKKNAYKI
jgi:hypothetical protein